VAEGIRSETAAGRLERPLPHPDAVTGE
jgi:hypothetical protein